MMTRWDDSSLGQLGDGSVFETDRLAVISPDTALLAAIFKTNVIGIAVTDAGATLLRANPTFCSLVGRSCANLIGSSILKLLHPDDAEKERQWRQAALTGGAHQYQAEQRYGLAEETIRLLTHTTLVWSDESTEAYFVSLFIGIASSSVPDMVDRKRGAKAEKPLTEVAGTTASQARYNVAEQGEELQITGGCQPRGELPHWNHKRTVPEFVQDGKVSSLFSIGGNGHAIKDMPLPIQALLDNFPDPVALFDVDGRFLYVSPATTRMFGIPADAFLGKTAQEVASQFSLSNPAQLHASIRQSSQGQPHHAEADMNSEAGQRTFEFRHVPVIDENGLISSVLGIARDLTAEREAERELKRLNRSLHLLSACRMALYQAESEQQLLDDICQLVTGIGGYRMCWVGYAQDDADKTVLPVADCGLAAGYLAEVRISWADNAYGQGVTGTAIRTGQPGVNRNFLTNPVMAPWREAALQHGYQSSIALPLRAEGRAFGALNIYAAEPDVFHDKESELLQELADTLAFGILSIRMRDEQRKAEEQLVLLSTALGEVRDAVFLIDMQGRFRYVNDQTVRSLGYSRDELIGMQVADIDNDWPAERVSQSFLNQPVASRYSIETWHRHKEGRRFPVEVSINHFTYKGERYKLALARDITERRQLEAARRESESRYRQIFDNSTNALYLMEVTEDERFRYIEVNPSFERMFGITREHMVGRFAPVTVVGENARKVLDKYRRCVAAGTTIDEEVALDLPVGWRHFQSTLVPVCDESGHIHRIVGITRDITERKKAETILHAREQEFRAFVENSPDTIIRYDTQCRRLYLNPVALDASGLPLDELLGHTPTETPHGNPEGARKLETYLWQVIASGEPVSGHLTWITADGRELYYDLRVVPEFDRSGKLASVLSIGRDILALKEAELHLQESRDLLRELVARRETTREEERKHIAREIHDELGQILTALRMDVSMLRLKFAQDNPALQGDVQRVVRTVDKTIQVVRNVAAKLRPMALDMGVVPAIEWLVAEFGRHGDVDCRLRVYGNETDLDERRAIVVFRIVQESLTNIARYAEATQVDITLESDSGNYWVMVCDNGKGFTPSKVKKTSFGLISMRERALMLGGSVHVFSEPGHGTEIRVRIPI